MVTSRSWFTAAQKAERGSDGKMGKVLRPSRGRWKGRTRPALSGSWYSDGGIVPAPRRRALAALRLRNVKRFPVALRWAGRSGRSRNCLGRAPSTVSREIRRNGGSQAYRANQADRRAWERALRPKPCRLALCRELRWRVARSSRRNGRRSRSSGGLKQEFPTHQDMQISHEAIYRSLFIQTRGVLKKELTAQLRTARRMRRPRATTRRVDRGISSIWSPSASGPPRLRIAPCRGIGKETFLPERTTRTSPLSSSAIPASRCSSRPPARTRQLLLLRWPSTSASCLKSCDTP